jgi:hypothetical protein
MMPSCWQTLEVSKWEETQLVAVVFIIRVMTCTNIFEIAEKITEKSPQQQF